MPKWFQIHKDSIKTENRRTVCETNTTNEMKIEIYRQN